MFDSPPLTEISFAVIISLLVIGWALIDPRNRRAVLLLWCGVTLVVLVGLGGAPDTLILAGAATIAARLSDQQLLRNAAALVGPLAVTLLLLLKYDLQTNLLWGSLVAAAAAGPLMWCSYRNYGQATVLVLAAVTATGIYINVPDTEQIAVIAAGLCVMALAAMAFTSIREVPVWFGSLALIGALVISAGAVGARGRPDAFIGVVGALGVLIGEPIVGILRRGTRAYLVVLIAAHAITVFIASRLLDESEPVLAVMVVAGLLGGATLLLLVAPRHRVSYGWRKQIT